MTQVASPPTVLRAHSGPQARCDVCGAISVQTELMRDPFIYGSGANAVELTADVWVHTCSACGDSYTDDEADVAYDEAVCRHLGVLTPAEIRDMREGYGLTRAEFAQLTGFGKATVGRWERGEVTQNRSADRYLRLLQEPGVMRRLRALGEVTDSAGLQTPARPRVFIFDCIQVSSQRVIRENARGLNPGIWKADPGLGFEAGAEA